MNRTFAAAPFALLLLAVTAPARAATIVEEPARHRFGVLLGREAARAALSYRRTQASVTFSPLLARCIAAAHEQICIALA